MRPRILLLLRLFSACIFLHLLFYSQLIIDRGSSSLSPLGIQGFLSIFFVSHLSKGRIIGVEEGKFRRTKEGGEERESHRYKIYSRLESLLEKIRLHRIRQLVGRAAWKTSESASPCFFGRVSVAAGKTADERWRAAEGWVARTGSGYFTSRGPSWMTIRGVVVEAHKRRSARKIDHCSITPRGLWPFISPVEGEGRANGRTTG